MRLLLLPLSARSAGCVCYSARGARRRPTILLAPAHVAPHVLTSASPAEDQIEDLSGGGGDRFKDVLGSGRVGKVMISLRGSGARWWTKQGSYRGRISREEEPLSVTDPEGRRERTTREGKSPRDRERYCRPIPLAWSRDALVVSQSNGAGIHAHGWHGLLSARKPFTARERERDGGDGWEWSGHDAKSGRTSSFQQRMYGFVSKRLLSREDVRVYNGKEGKVQGKGSDGARGNLLENKFRSAGASWCADRHGGAHLERDAVRVVQMARQRNYTTDRLVYSDLGGREWRCEELRIARIRAIRFGRIVSGKGDVRGAALYLVYAVSANFADDGEPMFAEWMCPVHTGSRLADQNASFFFLLAISDGFDASVRQDKYRAGFMQGDEGEHLERHLGWIELTVLRRFP
ncbi:hypothetical protein B0H19DRAFT_1074717 [Mycena capillaripes]|nr:hypothetical protein B0H19DRAFT_1074717 [Mycena capillaripes]